MRVYTHLTLSEREYLEAKLKEGVSLRKIAAALGRSPSTISREVNRNWSKKAKRYHHWNANNCYKFRRKQCHRKNNLTKIPAAYAFVFEKLLLFWSPEIIAGRWNKENEDKISFRSIYRAVRAGDFPGIKPHSHFRRKAKPYANRQKSYTRYFDRSIHEREYVVEQRGRLGDYEGDTVYGSVGKGYLITAVDRQSRLTVAAIARDKTVASTNAAFVSALSKDKRIRPVTLTLDNGTEFLGFKDLERTLDLKVYFADTHAPWQRGSNENVNGLLRFFFPRGTDFTKVTDEQLNAVLDLINNRPRKCLDFLSPNEFINKVLHLA